MAEEWVMRGNEVTYFTPENCLNHHFIVTGRSGGAADTNDFFCDESLRVGGIEEELSRHLHAQGFEAVLFFNYVNAIYCYDRRSWDILNAGVAGDTRSPSETGTVGSRIASKGPSGGKRRRRRNAARATSQQRVQYEGALRYSRRGMMIDRAWDTLGQILRWSDYRVAVVLSNVNSLQEYMTPNAIQALSEAGENLRHRNIVVYIFRGNTFDNLINSSESSTAGWSTFFRSFLTTGISSTGESENRVITIGAPNAAEIRAYLTHLRLRTVGSLRINPTDVTTLAENFAIVCAAKNRGLKYVDLRISRWAETHSGETLTCECFPELVDAESARLVKASVEAQIRSLVGMEDIVRDGVVVQHGVKSRLLQFLLDARGQHGTNVFPAHASRFTPPRQSGKQAIGHELNCRLTGNPGTGKTTVARLLGRLYHEAGYLTQGHVVERTSAQLISNHIGETAINVHAAVREAIGGVLFIDEAYAIAESNFGQEAIDQLVADTSAYAGEFAVILAGYKDQMDELMMRNDGLERRFPNEYNLPDYTPQEMAELIRLFVRKDPDHVVLSNELEAQLLTFTEGWTGSTYPWGNAGSAENLVSLMKQHHRLRMQAAGNSNEEDGYVLTSEDLPHELRHFLEKHDRTIEGVRTRIQGMVGLANVKRRLETIMEEIQYGLDNKVPSNYVFYGPPGTGKTTTARIMGDMLFSLSVITRGHVREIRAADLLVDDYKKHLDEVVKSARHGVLFIDEAHQLATSERGRAVIRALVPIVDDPVIRLDTCFILAGYAVEMKRFFEVDGGLERRFPPNQRIRFDDYDAHELTQILQGMLDKTRASGSLRYDGVTDQEYERLNGEERFERSRYLMRTELALTEYLKSRPQDFGNGGFIRDVYLPESRAKHVARLKERYGRRAERLSQEEFLASIPDEERYTLTGEDLPTSFAGWAGPTDASVEEIRTLVEAAQVTFGELVNKDEVISYLQGRGGVGEATDADLSAVDSPGMLFALAGPIGTGKHLVARAIARYLHTHGPLDRDDCLFVGKGDLEAGFVGQTTEKVDALVERYTGATIAVVAPSSMLAREGERSFGPEALERLFGCVGRHQADTAFVLIDNEEGMNALFCAIPSAHALLAREFHFEDYSPYEMGQILSIEARKSGIAFDEEVTRLLDDFLLNWVGDRGGLGENAQSWGNGLEIKKLLDYLRDAWRTAPHHRTTLSAGKQMRLVTRAMFPAPYARWLTSAKARSQHAMDDLMQLVGLDSVKEAVRAVDRRVRLLPSGSPMPGCYCFVGNPGTGKTMVARLMGQILQAAGALDQGHIVVRSARQLEYRPDMFAEAVKLAKNGVLFLDEAHQLMMSSAGQHIVKELVPIIEDVEIIKNTCIILAGYPGAIDGLLDFDPGLRSRFGTSQAIIRFEDYSASELLRIMVHMASRGNEIEQIGMRLDVSDGEFQRLALRVFEAVASRSDATLGNARFVRNFLCDVREELFARLADNFGVDADIPTEILCKVTAQDLPARYAAMLRIRDRAGSSAIDKATLRIDSAAPSLDDDAVWQDYLDQMEESVVFVRVHKAGQVEGTGSGFIVSREGHVVTCSHVVKGAERVEVRVTMNAMVGESFRWFTCDVLEPVSERYDLAIIKIRASRANFPCAPLRASDKPVVKGEEVMLVGYPLASIVNDDDDHVCAQRHEGRVSSLESRGDMELAFFSGMANPGDSGAPIISRMDGCVVGVLRGAEGKDVHLLPVFMPLRFFWNAFVPDDMSTNANEFDGDMVDVS